MSTMRRPVSSAPNTLGRYLLQRMLGNIMIVPHDPTVPLLLYASPYPILSRELYDIWGPVGWPPNEAAIKDLNRSARLYIASA